MLQIQGYTPATMAGRPPTKDAPLFGQRLATARKAKGWSQQQFAQVLGISRDLVNYYERQAKNPSLEFMQQAAQSLGIALTDLLAEGNPVPLRLKPGPLSQLEQRLERIRHLPRKEQDFILEFLDTYLQRTEKNTGRKAQEPTG